MSCNAYSVMAKGTLINVQTTVKDLAMNGLQQIDWIFMLFHFWRCNTVIGGSNISGIKTILTSLGFVFYLKFKLMLPVYYAKCSDL